MTMSCNSILLSTVLVLASMSACRVDSFSVSPLSTTTRSVDSCLSMGIFDDLQLIFSDEGKKNRAAFAEKERQDQEEAQRQIVERRRNPEKMQEYEAETIRKRKQLTEERELWDFQGNVVDGSDPMDEWNRLRDEGKIKIGSDLERDASTSRLGSEGLVEVRTDERMPYIDQGYVDEDSDLMGNFMNIFGGKKKDKDSEE
mmetsp:Transcript_11299/g.10812  ORF Transcript_11299/g.10812 Transcript_11299/m.10812 type:complete len:200 (-) Transcript_11299:65-664(-)|eukprot:CAMPEP_0197830280 /NCGR_PEP_ID=MMETSP1437-20131217/6879_1 /TAXON_ID=49252 ORGANISM="Eucampia antarctica, Strain CCMP1452" /NCGR_SAMPLE_ID=MMETSP1437 /ASSEMBLY_ACC=CAM_ASM_001096 /LENGTH=199 /DNA_ID=CAMNT_0043432571 /DNA_START=104 /DNA_END=703 /DNA_ORIENTATION=-